MYQRCLSALLCGAFFVLAGCSEDANAPRIISSFPPPGSLDAPRNGLIRVQFNEELRESSVPDDAIIVEYNGLPLAGTVSFEPSLNTISFLADEPLRFLRKYDVRLSGAIADRKGNATAEAGSEWAFWAADGVFSGNILIERQNTDATEPQIAFGPGEHGQIVWSQSDDTRINIWARSIRGLNLGTPIMVETDNAGNASAPQVAVDAQGNAIAVWSQSDGTRTNIWANRYTPPADDDGDGTWGTAEIIDTEDLGDASAPQIAYAADGSSAIAVWAQSDGTRTNIWASRYSSGGWSAAAIIDNDNADASAPQVVIDSNNNAIAIWAQNNRIYENRHIANAWGTAATIDDNAGTSAAAPQIAADANGNAIAVWSKSDGTRTNIWTNRFSSNSWGLAQLLETGDGEANAPHVAMNSAGNAIAAWSQFADADEDAENDPHFRIFVSRYTAAGGWSMDADPVDDFSPQIYVEAITEDGVSTAPQVVLDGDGNALVVWKVAAQIGDDPRSFVAANRYKGLSAHEDRRGWSGAAIIEAATTSFIGETGNPQIAIAPDFTAVAVWSKEDDDDLFHVLGSAFN